MVIKVDSYSNPTNTGQSYGPNNCCDGSMPGSSNGCDDPPWQKRDNRFTFCLREFGDMTTGISSCVGDVLMSSDSEINFDDAPINFTASRWLGLDNPLRLDGLSRAWQGAQTYIEVHDYNMNSNTGIIVSYQLVDLWTLNGQSSAFVSGTDFSPPTMYERFFGFGFLEMSFRLECNPGYTGDDCSVDIDECLLMDPVPCSGRGNCSHGINYFNCSCDPGYTGERCEVDIDECAVVNCSGNGFRLEVAAITGGVIGGVVVILVIIVLTIIIAVIIIKCKGKTTTTHQNSTDSETSYEEVEHESPQLTYDYVSVESPRVNIQTRMIMSALK